MEDATAQMAKASLEELFPGDGSYNGVSLEERYELINSVGEELVTEEELKAMLLKMRRKPRCYDGFEPSGRMHIAQGVFKSLNVNKLTKSGCHFVFWVADYFGMLNNKMGGDLKKIQNVGKYMIEVWKATGMDMDNVEFLWSSEEINKDPDRYWMLVMDIAMKNKLPRILRCSQIMGRSESDDLAASQIFYPCMQCADVFFLKADICQLGTDQRKVNMLAREYCSAKKPKQKNKPIILSHQMIMGLKEGQEKMSKSDPDSAIYMEDSEADVNRKIKSAFCPPQQVEKNPCLEYLKLIVFPKVGVVHVKRKPENNGDKDYTDYETLEADYVSGALHPGDLKPALSAALNTILQPVRDHFEKNEEAKKLLKLVRSYKTTR
eukprot:Nk52_evm23s1737 gene=Nk52_evmTU23s1737